ncbi:DNA polymerase-4 [Solilutibacter tolerans]|uniref:DNA polymerase-4 n=2 Tax=Solilutibacter tolerans TaxID=1604334 RepID=A0A1N6UIP6_9GAMM|nr:DNA polymerase-4 [Lysobacter tolerans]
MTLRCLFVDFNSYFASVEQHDEPRYRGRPLGVVPVLSPTTCCIAASYEAKAFGVKTGTPVWEALEKCPDIMLVQARPARYIQLHHALMALIEDCIHHERPGSIDEVHCHLLGRERQRENAVAIGMQIKRRLADFSDAIRCSIGIAPNRFLAKTASDMQKPDGLTVLEQTDLPHALHDLALRDLCGIGHSMEQRLQDAGINSVEALCSSSRERLRRAWGSIEGERFWLQLRGHELPERKTTKGSVGHSHVLGPELRNYPGMRSVLFKLLAKAAMRMRHDGYVARGLTLHIRFVGIDERYSRFNAFEPLSDTPTLLQLLARQLQSLERAERSGRWKSKRYPPLSVAVTLSGVEEVGRQSGELLPERGRALRVTQALDRINDRFGNNTLYFGAMREAIRHDAAPMRIPFSTIPDIKREDEGGDQQASSPQNDSCDHDLWLLRERQFKVLAETAHRESRSKSHQYGEDAPRMGADSWNWRSPSSLSEVKRGQTLPLFR